MFYIPNFIDLLLISWVTLLNIAFIYWKEKGFFNLQIRIYLNLFIQSLSFYFVLGILKTTFNINESKIILAAVYLFPALLYFKNTYSKKDKYSILPAILLITIVLFIIIGLIIL